MEQYGNAATYNVESVLKKNIVDSEYFRDTCGKLSTWEQVVDQIYYDVKDVEPWMSGNARGASTAFCLLYRLFTLVITEAQVRDLLSHTDSPYIRAIGFLYLRYVGNPRELWDWIQRYVQDDEEFTPSPDGYGKPVTMGDYVRDIFLEQYYFETIFPRIPKVTQDNFVSKLTSMGLPSKAVGNGAQGGPDRRGIEEANRRPASVKASLSVAFGQRAPNRATAREEGRGLGAGMRGALGAAGAPRSTPPLSSQDGEAGRGARPASGHRDAGRDVRHRDADRDGLRPARDREDFGRDRDRHANGAGPQDRDRHRGERYGRDAPGGERGRDYGSHRDRERDRERDRSHYQERERDRDRDRNQDAKRHRSDPYAGRDGRRGQDHTSRDYDRGRP